MTRADYIRQVDAMALPDGLRQTLAGLPSEGKTRAHNVRPYGGQETAGDRKGHPYDGQGARAGLEPAPTQGTRAATGRPYGKDGPRRATSTTRRISRWAPIAAALVLVVGLGMAAPAIMRFFVTGGDLTTPPPVTTDVPTPEGIISADVDVPDMVLDAAKAYVEERKVWRSEHSGVTEFVDGQWQEKDTGPLPIFDNWRIESLDPCYEEQPIPKDAGQYTVSIYLLNYRLHTTTPERLILAGAAEVDEEGWYLDTYPDSTYMVFLHEGGQMRYVYTTMINDSSPGNALFESDILGELEQALGAEGTLSDEELTELLAAEFPETKTTEDTWKLLGSSMSPEGRTLGVLQYEWEGSDGTPDGNEKWSNLLLGVYDNATGELTAPAVRVNGQFTYALPYSTGHSGQDYYVLCIGKNFGQGIAEYYSVALYFFDGTELKQVTSSPNAVFPPGTEDMFDPAKNEDFWDSSHQIVLAPGGFELFERNPDWDATPDREGKSPWRYVGYVPLTYKYPDMRAVESARRFFEDYYGGSSHYAIQRCELVPFYDDPDYPSAAAFRVVLGDEWSTLMDRMFLFDESGTLLGTRSAGDAVLTIDGKEYPLGISTRGIFGTPTGTNLIPEIDGRSIYSEWFDPNANSCGYSYYPETGEYRLSGISTIREDVYTARGIHVGSTVAELIAAYPECDTDRFGDQTHMLSYSYGNDLSLEFYFQNDPAANRETILARTITSINLSASYW